MSIRVEQFEAELTDLTPTSNNPRQINQKDFEKLKKSLKEFPEMKEIREVVIDENNRILGGHMRVRALKELGEKTIFVKQVFGLTEEQKDEFVIKDNIANGEWDMDELANSWSELPLDDWGIGVEWDTSEQDVVEDEAPEVDDNEPADSVEGGVYQLGRHRLMCGDSTDAGNVAILMDGQKADIAFTSPPYNAGHTATESAMGKVSKYENDNDNKSQEDYRQFLDNYLSICYDFADYTFMNIQSLSNNKRALIGVMYDNIDRYADTIIWDKINAQPAMAHKVLNSRFEFIHCFSEKGTRAIGSIDYRGTIDNIVALPPQRSNEYAEVHNATFTIDFASWFIRNFAKDSVLDSFGGTGTTLIACEQLGRKCFMMELDPKYCDVIRKRYWKLKTGSEEGWKEGTKEAK